MSKLVGIILVLVVIGAAWYFWPETVSEVGTKTGKGVFAGLKAFWSEISRESITEPSQENSAQEELLLGFHNST